MSKKILLSGVKPTGRPHIGNYFGAMKQFVDLQDKYHAHIFIADLHALTTVQNREELRENSLGVLLDYLAIGLDPEKTVIYKQSDVPEVAELTWIFNCLTSMAYLSAKGHAFATAIEGYTDATPARRFLNNKLEQVPENVNAGIFGYPILMTADILIHDADVVPVGLDQKQHIEIARDTAEKFNRIYGDTFKLPEPHILESVATVKGIDGRKMSKSYGNTIELFATDEEIDKAVKSIITDSESGVPQNVYALHSLLRDKVYLDEVYEKEKGHYAELKTMLAVDLKEFIKPMREKRDHLAKDKKKLLEILEDGGKKARERAEEKMEEVRDKVGLKLK